MIVEFILPIVLRAHWVATAAILAVLVLRDPARRLFGAELAYRLWLLPPAAALASLFPTLRGGAGPYAPLYHTGGPAEAWAAGHAAPLALVWAAGAALMALAMAWGEWRFQRLVRQGRAGPAVVGAAWPRLVTPRDYHARFNVAERALILAHERVHMARRDPQANLLIAVLQVAGWFNPLVHLAAAGARQDQELACDALVIERHPRERRTYGEALLRAQAGEAGSPIACFWALGPRHPLELRLSLLAQRPVTLRRYRLGLAVISALCVLGALLQWGLAPA